MPWKDGSRPEALDNVWNLYKTKIPEIIEANKILSEQFSTSGIDFTDHLVDQLFTKNKAGDLAGLTPEQTAAVLGMRNQGTQNILSKLQNINAEQLQKTKIAQQGSSALSNLASEISQMEIKNQLSQQAQMLQEFLAGLKEREVINTEKTGETNRKATEEKTKQDWGLLKIRKRDVNSQINTRAGQLNIEKSNANTKKYMAETDRMAVKSQNKRREEQTKVDWKRVGIEEKRFASDKHYRKEQLQLTRDKLAEQIREARKQEGFNAESTRLAWAKYRQLKRMQELDYKLSKKQYSLRETIADREEKQRKFERDMATKKFDFYKEITNQEQVRAAEEHRSKMADGRFNRMKLAKQIAHIDDYYNLAVLDSETQNNLSKIRLEEIKKSKQEIAEKYKNKLSKILSGNSKEKREFVTKLAELQSKAVATTVDEYNLKQKEAYAAAYNDLVPEQLGKLIAYYDGDFVPVEIPYGATIETSDGVQKLTKKFIYEYAMKHNSSVTNFLGYLVDKEYVYPSVED